MVCSSANRIRAGTTIPMDPGSYVILAETAGHERQVVPFLVPRKETVRLAVRLARQGTVPPGYVFVPESQFIYQGDPLAFDPHPAVPRTTPSFFIAVKEVTNQEWFAFVNEPSSLKRIRDMRQRVYLPREPSKILAVEDGSGGYKWVRGDASTPVYGISWNDAKDFIAWKNRNAIENNEEWTYDLPSQEQWELAARGADGREFPWGSRFDYAFTVSVHHRNDFLLDEPGGFAACDESPFGVLDMGGSRREFTRDRVQGMDPPAYYTRGSFWGQGSEIAFRAASRAFANADYAGGDTGLRLVARRRN
jgi:serine/threonine-protein kinase